MKKPYIIAIAGVSGGGKTAAAKQLASKLPRSMVLFFDDYDFEGPENIIEWVDKGADCNEWNLDPLIQDIKNRTREAFDYLILDYPFAYKHYRTSEWIDCTVFIDTPLDVAMARRIIRDFSSRSAKDILHDMENYLTQGRRGYEEMLKTIKPDSDIIVDGKQSLSNITDELYERILNDQSFRSQF
ncbi:hypothetical protein P6709_05700 [Jeotgalibacillus sp. ET6]|uniref:hypothetical protein n=1 Tax=Jeotgalibacillus sp. ET6 TaxID=3037260 RepID=UPI002418998B|nr:hypothetical protein [Jeotgalibacillus sp. ET6]MDG5471234.1 hypothetical protein [Jeotgalibacillus sp. ET6]